MAEIREAVSEWRLWCNGMTARVHRVATHKNRNNADVMDYLQIVGTKQSLKSISASMLTGHGHSGNIQSKHTHLYLVRDGDYGEKTRYRRVIKPVEGTQLHQCAIWSSRTERNTTSEYPIAIGIDEAELVKSGHHHLTTISSVPTAEEWTIPILRHLVTKKAAKKLRALNCQGYAIAVSNIDDAVRAAVERIISRERGTR